MITEFGVRARGPGFRRLRLVLRKHHTLVGDQAARMEIPGQSHYHGQVEQGGFSWRGGAQGASATKGTPRLERGAPVP